MLAKGWAMHLSIDNSHKDKHMLRKTNKGDSNWLQQTLAKPSVEVPRGQE